MSTTTKTTRIEAAALAEIAKSGRVHFQLSPGGLKVLRRLERRGLVRALADGYYFAAVAS